MRYINWEEIDQKKYTGKISAYTEKLEKQQRELFTEIFNCIKNAGGVEENVLYMLLEEPVDEYKGQKLELLYQYLKKDTELEKINSELAFYKKRLQGSEEKNKLLKKEIMELRTKSRELNKAFAKCQEQLSQAEEENRKNSEEKAAFLQLQENMGQIMTESREIKEILLEKLSESKEIKEMLLENKQMIFRQISENCSNDTVSNDVISNTIVSNDNITNDTVSNDSITNAAISNDTASNDSISNDTVLNKNSVTVQKDIISENHLVTAPEDSTEKTGEKREEKEAENIETEEDMKYAKKMDDAFYTESMGIEIENIVDSDAYGTFMEAAPDEIMYYPLEEENELENGFEETGMDRRVDFFNQLLEKMDKNRFQSLEPSRQLAELFELAESKELPKEEKREFMQMIMGDNAEYGEIYQYIKEGKKELLKEEKNG